MHVRKTVIMIMCAGIASAAVLLCTCLIATAGQSTEALKETLDNVVDVLNDQRLKKKEHRTERKQRLHALLSDRIDKQEFARRALGAHWKSLDPEEQGRFVSLFIAMLEDTYFEKIDGYVMKIDHFDKSNIIYRNEKTKGCYAVVDTTVIADQETRIPVTYLMKNAGKDWLISDIAIEGVSLAKNYRAQFNDIIANDSFSGLIKRLEDRKITQSP